MLVGGFVKKHVFQTVGNKPYEDSGSAASVIFQVSGVYRMMRIILPLQVNYKLLKFVCSA
jgi:hypothetical protein